jgi:hypothetical protein
MIELGMMRESRRNVREAIRLRLPEAMTPEVERAIADEPSRLVLREWFVAAITAKTAEEFLAILCVPSVVTHANGEASPCSMPRERESAGGA